MILKVMTGAAPGSEVREKEADKNTMMDGWGLEASQHADTMQEAAQEKSHQQ